MWDKGFSCYCTRFNLLSQIFFPENLSQAGRPSDTVLCYGKSSPRPSLKSEWLLVSRCQGTSRLPEISFNPGTVTGDGLWDCVIGCVSLSCSPCQNDSVCLPAQISVAWYTSKALTYWFIYFNHKCKTLIGHESSNSLGTEKGPVDSQEQHGQMNP